MSRYCVTFVAAVFGIAFLAAPAVAQDKPTPGREKPAKPQAKEQGGKEEAKTDAKPREQSGGAGQVTCPVMTSRPINKKYSVKYQGKDVYFCCGKCPARFEENPEKYAEAVKAQWAALRPLAIQVKCPGTGKKVDRKISAESDHGPVYFCCPNCKAAWEKDSAKMKAKLADCYSYQTLCPVTGEEIDPAVSVEKDGQTVYFCCADCMGQFEKDPAKYVANVKDQIKANKAASEKAHAEKKAGG